MDDAVGFNRFVRIGVEAGTSGDLNVEDWRMAATDRTVGGYVELVLHSPDPSLRRPFGLFVGGGVGVAVREARMPFALSESVAARFTVPGGAFTAPYSQYDVPALEWEPVVLPRSAWEVSIGTRVDL